VAAYAGAAATGAAACCLMKSAARSPIMIVGAFVLPRTIDGITDASVDPQPVDPEHLQLRVDDLADRGGRGRVIDRHRLLADVPHQLVVAGVGRQARRTSR